MGSTFSMAFSLFRVRFACAGGALRGGGLHARRNLAVSHRSEFPSAAALKACEDDGDVFDRRPQITHPPAVPHPEGARRRDERFSITSN
jgi:hypothetical protein